MIHKQLNADLKEQAYWTLLAIIERILPADFYSPTLLASRADQQVLSELVAQFIPQLHDHLESLGIDLASITFGWFLSLFTDCLPVEVSLCVTFPDTRHSFASGMYSLRKAEM